MGYDEITKTLEIQFHNGGIYQYYDIPKRIYEEMMKAPSLGRFFLFEIKGGYQYAKVA
jgi:hypothetical protein